MTNLLGAILVKLFRCIHCDGYYLTRHYYSWGVSLGKYIIFGRVPTITGLKHEQGHQKQYAAHPHTYLFRVGIPRLCGDIYARLMKKDAKWYYSQPWEAEADRLGGVKR